MSTAQQVEHGLCQPLARDMTNTGPRTQTPENASFEHIPLDATRNGVRVPDEQALRAPLN